MIETKLLKELDFLESELEYLNSIIYVGNKHFQETVETLIKKYPQLEIELPEITESLNVETSVIINELIDNPIKNMKEDDISLMYRKIAKLTHPDKINNTYLNSIFYNASKYYDINDRIGLYKICHLIGFGDIIPFPIDEIQDRIKYIKEQISFITKGGIYKWVSGNEEERKEVILNYISVLLNNRNANAIVY